MKIEAVTVCVNYADFLNVTAEYNRHIFDKWIIVTTERDEETREVCRKYNLETILTDDFYKDGPNEFAKARGINQGLEQLSANSWRCHLDADIVLPNNFRKLFNLISPDPTCIYGCDRIMLHSWEEWVKFRDSKHLWHDYYYRMQVPTGYDIGTRWVSPFYGFVPIGFLQIWFASQDEWKGIKIRRYSDNHSDSSRTDIKFALQWNRRKRILIPEMFAVHLESERCPLGYNWKQRQSKRFSDKSELLNMAAKNYG